MNYFLLHLNLLSLIAFSPTAFIFPRSAIESRSDINVDTLSNIRDRLTLLNHAIYEVY